MADTEPDPIVSIHLSDLNDRQLTLLHIQLLHTQTATLTRIENFMADLTTSVASLQEAVDTIAVRFASQLAPLTEALAAAQAALEAAAAEDITQNQALADAVAQATEAVNLASTAAEAIDAQVVELNAIGAAPDVPVEPVPVEDLP